MPEIEKGLLTHVLQFKVPTFAFCTDGPASAGMGILVVLGIQMSEKS